MSYFSPGLIRFGPFEFHPRNRELRKHGMRVKLTPHEISLLCLLIELPLRVRTREEIQRHLWPANTFVDFEHGTNKVVHSLRQALGDSATNPRYIETVNATGYRFIPQFLTSTVVDKPDLFSNATTIAVLPIETSGPQDMVHRSDRITFHLIAGLAELRHRVVAQATLRSYKLRDTSPRQAGEILGVDVVISGELIRNEGTLSLSAELINVSDGSHLGGAYCEIAELNGSHCEERLVHSALQQFRSMLAPRTDNPQLTFDSAEFVPQENGKPIPRRRPTDVL